MKKSLLIASLLVLGCLVIGQRDSYAADGAEQNQSAEAVSDSSGSSKSSSEFTKNRNVTTSGFRSTSAQSIAPEASFQSNAPDNSTGGLQHTASCADAEGELVTCSAVK